MLISLSKMQIQLRYHSYNYQISKDLKRIIVHIRDYKMKKVFCPSKMIKLFWKTVWQPTPRALKISIFLVLILFLRIKSELYRNKDLFTEIFRVVLVGLVGK